MTELCCRCNLPKAAPKANSGSAAFRHICRLCLMRAEDTEPIFIHPGDNTLAKKILACTGVEVDENVVVGPTNICMSCKTTVYKSYQFWELCQRNNKIIQNLLSHEKSDAGNESPPSRDDLRVVIRTGPSLSSETPTKRKRALSGRRKSTRRTREESTSASDISWSECDEENNDLDEDVDEVLPFRQLAYDTDTQDDSPKRKKPLADLNGGQMPSLVIPPAQTNGTANHQPQPSVSGGSESPQGPSSSRAASQPPVPDVPIECEFCDASFPNRNQRNQHIALCHGDRKNKLTCKVCAKYFTTTAELKDHRAEKHPRNSAASGVECTLCQRTYTSKQGLKQHFRSITHRAASGEAVFPRRRWSNLKSPARSASTDDSRGYQSDSSPGHPGLWDENSNPYEHVSYNEIQSYDCDYCDERFDDRQDLADHTAVRPCQIEIEPLNLDLLQQKIDLDEMLQQLNSQSDVSIIEPTITFIDLTL